MRIGWKFYIRILTIYDVYRRTAIYAFKIILKYIYNNMYNKILSEQFFFFKWSIIYILIMLFSIHINRFETKNVYHKNDTTTRQDYNNNKCKLIYFYFIFYYTQRIGFLIYFTFFPFLFFLQPKYNNEHIALL